MRILLCLVISCCACAGFGTTTASTSHGRLLRPDTHGSKAISLHIHLHGAPEVVEENFRAARRPGALLTINRPGLSSVYQQYFADPAVWPALLAEVKGALDEWAGEEVKVGPVSISSFSAGFAGVRELLKQPEAFARIEALILADLSTAASTGQRETASSIPT